VPFIGLQLLHNLCLAFGGDAHEPDIERDGNEIFLPISENEREREKEAIERAIGGFGWEKGKLKLSRTAGKWGGQQF